MISQHRILQLIILGANLTANARQDRIRAGKAASIGNKNAAAYFVNRARKADVLFQYRILPRLQAAAKATIIEQWCDSP